MGKLIKILIIIVGVLFSCGKESSNFFEGQSQVTIVDSSKSYQITGCVCWIENNSLKIFFGEYGYAGISIEVTHKIDNVNVYMEYWSDTNEYDGDFSKSILVNSQNISITYHDGIDEIKIEGELNIDALSSEENSNIKAVGKFSCGIPKSNL
jgi:hypothetical protein